jgi:hypothetical protein
VKTVLDLFAPDSTCANRNQGTILFYLAKSGAFDENNALLKFGRVRLSFDPNPFDGGSFEQRLLLNDGYVRYTGNDNTTVKLWIDVFNPVVHVEVESPQELSLDLAYENWRYQDRGMVGEERSMAFFPMLSLS